MMLGQHFAWQAQALREQAGSLVTFEGVEYAVITEPESALKAGTHNVPLQHLGAYAASADPRLFRFSPDAFARNSGLPAIDLAYPQEGSELLWHGLRYRVAAVAYDDLGPDTVALNVFAYREVA